MIEKQPQENSLMLAFATAVVSVGAFYALARTVADIVRTERKNKNAR